MKIVLPFAGHNQVIFEEIMFRQKLFVEVVSANGLSDSLELLSPCVQLRFAGQISLRRSRGRFDVLYGARPCLMCWTRKGFLLLLLKLMSIMSLMAASFSLVRSGFLFFKRRQRSGFLGLAFLTHLMKLSKTIS